MKTITNLCTYKANTILTVAHDKNTGVLRIVIPDK